MKGGFFMIKVTNEELEKLADMYVGTINQIADIDNLIEMCDEALKDKMN